MENINEIEKQRPTFLTVLCILTFIGSGFSLISNIFSFIKSPNSDEMMQNMEAQFSSTGNGGEGEAFFASLFSSSMEMMEHASTLALMAVIGAAISLGGAIMMYQLNKKGYYVYTVAQLFILFTPILIVGFSTAALIGAGFTAIGVVLFLTLYGLNLKHMKA